MVGLKRHVKVHKMSGDDGNFEEMAWCVRIEREFKRRSIKSVNQSTINMMNARVN